MLIETDPRKILPRGGNGVQARGSRQGGGGPPIERSMKRAPMITGHRGRHHLTLMKLTYQWLMTLCVCVCVCVCGVHGTPPPHLGAGDSPVTVDLPLDLTSAAPSIKSICHRHWPSRVGSMTQQLVPCVPFTPLPPPPVQKNAAMNERGQLLVLSRCVCVCVFLLFFGGRRRFLSESATKDDARSSTSTIRASIHRSAALFFC